MCVRQKAKKIPAISERRARVLLRSILQQLQAQADAALDKLRLELNALRLPTPAARSVDGPPGGLLSATVPALPLRPAMTAAELAVDHTPTVIHNVVLHDRTTPQLAAAEAELLRLRAARQQAQQAVSAASVPTLVEPAVVAPSQEPPDPLELRAVNTNLLEQDPLSASSRAHSQSPSQSSDDASAQSPSPRTDESAREPVVEPVSFAELAHGVRAVADNDDDDYDEVGRKRERVSALRLADSDTERAVQAADAVLQRGAVDAIDAATQSELDDADAALRGAVEAELAEGGGDDEHAADGVLVESAPLSSTPPPRSEHRQQRTQPPNAPPEFVASAQLRLASQLDPELLSSALLPDASARHSLPPQRATHAADSIASNEADSARFASESVGAHPVITPVAPVAAASPSVPSRVESRVQPAAVQRFAGADAEPAGRVHADDDDAQESAGNDESAEPASAASFVLPIEADQRSIERELPVLPRLV